MPTADPIVEECERCRKKALYDIEPSCRACNHPIASRAPNVTFARRLSPSVEARYRTIRDEAERNGTGPALAEFEDLARRTAAVVAMNSGLALDFFSRWDLLYTSQGNLVEAGARSPAQPDQDRLRGAVDNLMYGSYGNDMVFAALSADGRGLISYGPIHLELDEVTIDFRSTVLEGDSCEFVQQHRLVPGDPFPGGYLVLWSDRHKLAVAKLANRVREGLTDADCCKLLLDSTGMGDPDVFLEVHIYGTFNRQAVRRVRFSAPDTDPDMDDETRDQEAVRSRWLKQKLERLAVEWSGA